MRYSLLLLILLIGVGCSRQASPPAPQPTSPPAPVAPAPVAPAPSPMATERKPPAPVRTDELKRVTLGPGEQINAPGYYYQDVATGKVDGWQALRNYAYFDDRWVLTDQQDQAYLADRATGIVYGYDSRQYRFLTAGKDKLLFEELENRNTTGRIVLFTDRMEPAGRFAVPGTASAQALLSPDGRAVAILQGNLLHVIDLPGGTIRKLTDESAGFYGSQLQPWSQSGFALFLYKSGVTVARRYSWDGQAVPELSLAGYTREVSPGGQYIALWQTLQSAVPTTVWYDAPSGQPILRVMGAIFHRWVAGDQQLYLANEEGGAWLVSQKGELTAAPPAPKRENVFDMGLGQLRPAPADPNLFAVGTSVIDGTGKVRQAAWLTPGQGGWMVDTAWNADGKEIRIRVLPFMGKGWDRLPNLPLPPKVQRPPFDDRFLLKVQVPAGDCLNLRDEASVGGKVIRCLPPGTRLAIRQTDNNDPRIFTSMNTWLPVVTEKGEEGYVAVSAETMAWAD